MFFSSIRKKGFPSIKGFKLKIQKGLPFFDLCIDSTLAGGFKLGLSSDKEATNARGNCCKRFNQKVSEADCS